MITMLSHCVIYSFPSLLGPEILYPVMQMALLGGHKIIVVHPQPELLRFIPLYPPAVLLAYSEIHTACLGSQKRIIVQSL